MSAYIVDDTTINRILSYLSIYDFHALADAVFGAGTRWEIIGSELQMGAALRALNERAVSQRYPGEAPEALPGPVPYAPYVYKPLLVSAVQAYKSLACLLYQCSEGDVPQTPLYRALQDIRARVASEIIDALPAYQKAAWG